MPDTTNKTANLFPELKDVPDEVLSSQEYQRLLNNKREAEASYRRFVELSKMSSETPFSPEEFQDLIRLALSYDNTMQAFTNKTIVVTNKSETKYNVFVMDGQTIQGQTTVNKSDIETFLNTLENVRVSITQTYDEEITSEYASYNCGIDCDCDCDGYEYCDDCECNVNNYNKAPVEKKAFYFALTTEARRYKV